MPARPTTLYPYGPAKGMIQGIQLLQRTTPTQVNEDVLRSNSIAPNNEYKVVGALRFLGLVDEEGRPTEKSRLLKTRGATFTLALQEIVRQAYDRLFSVVPPREATRERIYNFLVTKESMGPEMAIKATRCLIDLCSVAGIELGAHGERSRTRRTESMTTGRGRTALARVSARTVSPRAARTVGRLQTSTQEGGGLTLSLAVTPELVDMSEDELARFLRKLGSAWQRAFEQSA